MVQELTLESFYSEKAVLYQIFLINVMNGYGKTLAFVIPAILKSNRKSPCCIKEEDEMTKQTKTILTPDVIIFVDANPLAQQIKDII